MEPNGQPMQQVTIRRASVVDADKVRYRVYSSPTEFVAVIAASALMAVKTAGIKNPHKVMRDLPTDGVAIEAKKMAVRDDTQATVAFPLTQGHAPRKHFQVEVASPAPEAAKQFVPMGVADLRHAGGVRARILPPDMVHQIIEEHAKAASVAVPVASPAEAISASPVTPPTAEPLPEILMATSEPELSPAEKLVKMAEEILPPMANEAPATPVDPAAPLKPDEVEKLLNE